MLTDLRLATRLLMRERWFSLAAISALALGIGANTTIYTIVSATMLRAPVAGADRLLVLKAEDTTNRRTGSGALSFRELEDWQTAARTLDTVTGHFELDMNLADDVTAPARLPGAYVSAGSFALVGERPIAGRDFRADDETPGTAAVAIISHTVWQARYGGEPGAVGRVVRINGRPITIVGVMPEGFGYPQIAQVWRPLGQLPDAIREDRTRRVVVGVATMRAGVTIDQTRADLERVAATLAAERPDTNRGIVPVVTTFREESLSTQGRIVLSTLMVAVAFVLLIACANVANLMLARAVRREREISLRLSIGASRWRIVRQLVFESLPLAVIAGVGGLALSLAGIEAFARSLSEQGAPYWLNLRLDAQIFAFVAMICLGTVVIVGLVPALRASSLSLAGAMNEGGRGHSGGLRTRRLTGGFVVAQLTLTLVLLAGATLSVHDLATQLRTDLGVRTEGITVAELTLPQTTYANSDRRALFYGQLADRLASAPAIRTTFASAWPRGGGVRPEVVIEGQGDPGVNKRPRVTRVAIGPRYFETLDTRPVRGRDFTVADRGGVAIVNERFAAMHAHGGSIIGRRVKLGTSPDVPESSWLTVVGVAPNVRQHLLENDPGFDPVVYVPYADGELTFAMLLARSTAESAAVVGALREQIRTIDPDLPLSRVMPLGQALASDQWEVRFISTSFSSFAAIALVLATLGVYAVTSYGVSQRTREIGIRLALGARVLQVWWLVTRRAATHLLIGLTIGMPLALAVGQILGNGLETVSPTDPVTFIGVPVVLAGASLSACLLPARRAMRLDPVVALRAE